MNLFKIKKRIIIRNQFSNDKLKPRLFDVLVSEKEVYFEIRKSKTECETVSLSDVIKQVRDAMVPMPP